MKKFLQMRLNEAQLKLIVGDSVKHDWPTKTVCTKVGKEVERKQSDTVSNILKKTSEQTLKSFDDRFDGEHPLTLKLKTLSETGMSKTMIAAIRNSHNCQKKKQIIGKWKVMNDIISDEHKAVVIDLLERTHAVNLEKFGSKYYA